MQCDTLGAAQDMLLARKLNNPTSTQHPLNQRGAPGCKAVPPKLVVMPTDFRVMSLKTRLAPS